MSKVFGVLSILAGIGLGAWLFFWVFVVGGIKQFVSGVTADPVNGSDIAWGVVRVFFASSLSGAAAFILIAGGAALIASGEFRVRRRKTNSVQPPAGWNPPSFPRNPYL